MLGLILDRNTRSSLRADVYTPVCAAPRVPRVISGEGGGGAQCGSVALPSGGQLKRRVAPSSLAEVHVRTCCQTGGGRGVRLPAAGVKAEQGASVLHSSL